MKICLAYDDWSTFRPQERMPEDFGAEFDEEKTIQNLLDAIHAAGFEADKLPVDGDFPRRVRDADPDLVFNIAEGTRGPSRESIVPTWLDHAGIPYTGADGRALACSLDKALSKTIVSSKGVSTPESHLVQTLSDLDQCQLGFPVFVKPNAEGSSMGIRHSSLIGERSELREKVRWILQEYQQGCLVEEFAPGREFCVGLLGNSDVEVLPVVEVQSSRNFYSYEDKSRHEKELTCPADIPDELTTEMRRMGRTVYRALRCRDLARVDIKLDEKGQPTFLEVNPLPGLSPDYSIFPFQAEAAGYSYPDMISQIIEAAVERSTLNAERTTI